MQGWCIGMVVVSDVCCADYYYVRCRWHMAHLRKCVDEIVMPRHSAEKKKNVKKKMKRKYVAEGFIDTCTLKLTAHVSRQTNERIISFMRSTFCFRFADGLCLPRASIDVDAIGNMRPNTNRYTDLTRERRMGPICAFCFTHSALQSPEEWRMECCKMYSLCVHHHPTQPPRFSHLIIHTHRV